MKKFLPLILLLVGVAVLVGAYFFIKGGKKENSTRNEDETVAVIPSDKMPSVSLSKTADGHYLRVKIEGLSGLSPSTLDYELLYEVPGKEQPQGTGSSVPVEGQDSFEAELLLGTESSGKFRYDEGVEKGTLTLKFRNDAGKLIGRTKTDFDLASESITTSSY